MNITSIKTKINNKAKRLNLSPQDLMQMYFFERILYRVSISEYKYNFIIKESITLREYWDNYQRKNYYAKNISYDDFANSVESIINIIIFIKQSVQRN